MNALDFELFVRVLIAHFLADFVLQSTKMANEKDKHGVKSRYFWLHIGIHVLTLAVILWDYHLWPVLLCVSLGHLITDAAKTLFRNSTIWVFLIDQSIHVLVITLVWLIYTQQGAIFFEKISELNSDQQIWGLILSYLVVTFPAGILIGKLTDKWAKELEPSFGQGQKSGLKNAGKWIGILERTMILTFIIASKMSAIGFILAAKSVFRFGDLKDARDHKKTEYIIIGTMLSFVFAIGTGLFYKIVYQ